MKITDHSNLTEDQKSFLGYAADLLSRKSNLLHQFNDTKVKKDFISLSYDMVYNENKIKEVNDKLDSYNIPVENINLLNAGIYKGLVNHNRITYTAYYE